MKIIGYICDLCTLISNEEKFLKYTIKFLQKSVIILTHWNVYRQVMFVTLADLRRRGYYTLSHMICIGFILSLYFDVK